MRLRLFLRLFLIQALWNYRTMLGPGLAWVLVPVLREAAGGDEGRAAESLHREAGHFNAHPYFAGVAVGALARLEREGEEPEMLRRFRDALRGPLGSLGDGLVWTAWLPACLLACILAGAVAVSPLAAIIGFLVLYNALHLPLRWWGVTVGLAFGKEVGAALRRAAFPRWAERAGRLGVLLLGLLAGGTLADALTAMPADAAAALPSGVGAVAGSAGAMAALGLLLFLLGLFRGRGAWWWTPVLIPGVLAGIVLVGLL